MLHKNSFMKFFLSICFLLIIFPGQSEATLYMGISGKVFDAETNTGVGRVKVALMSIFDGKKVSEALSTSDGTFVLKDVPSGMYNIWTVPNDNYFIPSEKAIPVTVPRGKNVVGVSVPVHKGGAIKGRIVTGKGVPVPEVNVMSSTGSSDFTDSNGNFTIKGVKTGTVKIAVVPAAMGIKSFSITCEKDKTTDAGAIVLTLGSESKIKGSIVDTAGKPVQGAVLLATSPDTHGGYTMSAESGAFIFLGLAGKKYKLSVIAYGYEPVNIPDVAVPSDKLKITMLPASNQTAGIWNERNFRNPESLLSNFADFLSPRRAFAQSCSLGSCPDGKWVGASADVTPAINIPGWSLSGGDSFSLGSYYCLSARTTLPFKQSCLNRGAAFDAIATLGLSVTVSGAWGNACCANNLLDRADGTLYGLSKASGVGGGFALDFGGGVNYASLNMSYTIPTLDWRRFLADIKNLQLGSHVVSYRSCNVTPFNFFEWLCDNDLGCL